MKDVGFQNYKTVYRTGFAFQRHVLGISIKVLLYLKKAAKPFLFPMAVNVQCNMFVIAMGKNGLYISSSCKRKKMNISKKMLISHTESNI